MRFFLHTISQMCGAIKPPWEAAMNRSSRPEVFCKKGVLRNFTKFTGKHLCQSVFFNKVAGLRPPVAASVLVFEPYIAWWFLPLAYKSIYTWALKNDREDHWCHWSVHEWTRLLAWGLQLNQKRDSGTGVFFKFCKIFKSTFFIEHLQMTALTIIGWCPLLFQKITHFLSWRFQLWETEDLFSECFLIYILLVILKNQSKGRHHNYATKFVHVLYWICLQCFCCEHLYVREQSDNCKVIDSFIGIPWLFWSVYFHTVNQTYNFLVALFQSCSENIIYR